MTTDVDRSISAELVRPLPTWLATAKLGIFIHWGPDSGRRGRSLLGLSELCRRRSGSAIEKSIWRQDHMKYGELGRSGMNVSKICLGTMHFGPKATEEESHAILDKALSMGITFIDTANVYGGEAARGRSEEIIGTWFAARPGVLGGGAGDQGLRGDGRSGSGQQQPRLLGVQGAQAPGGLLATAPNRQDRPLPGPPHRRTVRPKVLGNVRAHRGRRRGPLRGFEQLLGLGSGQAADAGLAAGFHGIRLRADAVQLAEPGTRDGGSPGGAGLRDRGDRLHAVGGRSTDGQDRVPRRSRTRQVEEEYGIRVGPENRRFRDFSQLCPTSRNPRMSSRPPGSSSTPRSLPPLSAFGPSISLLGSIGLPNWSWVRQPRNG